MNKLIAELQRLYFLPGQQWQSRKLDDGASFTACAEDRITPDLLSRNFPGEASVVLDLVSEEGRVRTLIIEFERSADWERVAELYQGLHEHLDLPTPAIAVSGKAGFTLWLSLAEPIPVAQAQIFLNAIQLKYLADIPAIHLKLLPVVDASVGAEKCQRPLVPARHETTGKWSAFIDAGLGSLFIEAPGLEMAPNTDRQADILSRLECIKPEHFTRALDILQLEASTAARAAESATNGPVETASSRNDKSSRWPSKLNLGATFSDPKSFLLAVMNDSSATAGQRIRAAKALLPYFDDRHN